MNMIAHSINIILSAWHIGDMTPSFLSKLVHKILIFFSFLSILSLKSAYIILPDLIT